MLNIRLKYDTRDKMCLHKLHYIYYSICAIMVFFLFHLMVNVPVAIKVESKKKLSKNLVITSYIKENTNMKFILLWTDTMPFINMGVGQEIFKKKHCLLSNCYVTTNKTFFSDLTKFDVIVFHAPTMIDNKTYNFPIKRNVHQKYAFLSLESSHYYQICDHRYDRIFNWTWTYKLNSDQPIRYIAVRNKKGEVIGPKTIMNWIQVEDMDPITEKVKCKLNTKNKAAAWLVSNCDAKNKRQYFVKDVQNELKKYNLTVNVFGKCSKLECSLRKMKECAKMIQRDYFFYLSLENSFSQDYVTEKLLHALHNYAIPVVYGGANYTRFMPHGIYLDGRKMGARFLAAKMKQIIDDYTYRDKDAYYNYFKWQ